MGTLLASTRLLILIKPVCIFLEIYVFRTVLCWFLSLFLRDPDVFRSVRKPFAMRIYTCVCPNFLRFFPILLPFRSSCFVQSPGALWYVSFRFFFVPSCKLRAALTTPARAGTWRVHHKLYVTVPTGLGGRSNIIMVGYSQFVLLVSSGGKQLAGKLQFIHPFPSKLGYLAIPILRPLSHLLPPPFHPIHSFQAVPGSNARFRWLHLFWRRWGSAGKRRRRRRRNWTRGGRDRLGVARRDRTMHFLLFGFVTGQQKADSL